MQKVQLGEGARGYELVQRHRTSIRRERAIPSHISDENFIPVLLREYFITAQRYNHGMPLKRTLL